jgi:hypothetical protein
MKQKISWGVLLLCIFLLLIISDWKNIKYFFNLIKELHKIFKKGSEYKEDDDFILILKPGIKMEKN